ncbi:MAG: hypothetical protein PVTTEEND_000542, partial [Candidatus Fervidibacter sp.]
YECPALPLSYAGFFRQHFNAKGKRATFFAELGAMGQPAMER